MEFIDGHPSKEVPAHHQVSFGHEFLPSTGPQVPLMDGPASFGGMVGAGIQQKTETWNMTAL